MESTENQNEPKSDIKKDELKKELDFLIEELRSFGKTQEEIAKATGYTSGSFRTAKSSGVNLKRTLKAVRKYHDKIKKKVTQYDNNTKKLAANEKKTAFDKIQELKEEISELRAIIEEVLKSDADDKRRLAFIEDILLKHLPKELSNQKITVATTPTSTEPKSVTPKPRKRKPKQDDDQQASES